ncbi:DUF3093 family protein [Embleya sp. NBC_00896]|uniref:DUF3093 family protein n=1 Tax=Embleya sp. NBC_00896 TaxID=2975961 RepID=UPI002F90CED2|nr:DUF3093 family protein [Embleya sp. NBC_00896]
MYRERSPKTWSLTCIGIYLVGVVWMRIDTPAEDTGVWLGVSALFLLLLLPCLAVPVSKFVYHRIELTPETLRVGRERIPVAALDPASVQAAAQGAPPTFAQQLATSAGTVDAPFPGLRAADFGAPRLVGGAWGVPMGMDTVVIRTRDNQALTIATRDRAAFLHALVAATSAPPHGGGWGPGPGAGAGSGYVS